MCLLLVLCLLCGFVVCLGFVLFRFVDLGGLFCICLLCLPGLFVAVSDSIDL